MAYARASWPDLAAQAGVDPAAYVLQAVSCRREGADGARCVVRAGGTDAFALKFRLPFDSARFSRTLAAHQSAAEALNPLPDVGAVPVIGHDPARGVLMLPWLAGETLDTHLSARPDDGAKTLALAGRILHGLVAAAPTEAQAFTGDWQLRRLDQMPAGDLPGKAAFAKHRASLGALADALGGADMTKGRIHGDFRLANLLWDGATLTVLDLENTQSHPVVRDVAQLLVDAAVWTGERPLDGQGTQAFIDALGLSPPDTRLLRFFVAFQLLHLWAGTPRPNWKRSPRQMHQLRRARKLLPIVLGS